MASRTLAEHERYEAEMKFKRDEQARLEYAINEGTRIGFEKGRALFPLKSRLNWNQ